MNYFGGKFRIGKQLAEVINNHGVIRYHEPFCGVYSVGKHVLCTHRSGSDVHPDLISLLRAVQSGWVPPNTISEADYRKIRKLPPSPLRGFVGFGCSFSGKFFGGYSRDNTDRNYALNAKNSLLRLAPLISDVMFKVEDYTEYCGDADVIYCDPPYRGTTGYTVGSFDSDQFWDWARSQTATVFVSEYDSPCGDIVWEKNVKTDMHGKTGKLHRVERLYKI